MATIYFYSIVLDLIEGFTCGRADGEGQLFCLIEEYLNPFTVLEVIDISPCAIALNNDIGSYVDGDETAAVAVILHRLGGYVINGTIVGRVNANTPCAVQVSHGIAVIIGHALHLVAIIGCHLNIGIFSYIQLVYFLHFAFNGGIVDLDDNCLRSIYLEGNLDGIGT